MDSKNEVLDEFANEPNRDLPTLHWYLKRYPEFKDDILNLAATLILNHAAEILLTKSNPRQCVKESIEEAWNYFVRAGQTKS